VSRGASTSDAALFSVSSLLLSALYLLPTALYMRLLLPFIARWSLADRPRFVALFHVGAAAMAGGGALITGMVLLGAPFVVPLVFGKAYASSAAVFSVMSLAVPFRLLGSVYGSVLFLRESMRRKVVYHVITAVVFLALAVALVPSLGAMGAAVATLVGDILLTGLHIFGLKAAGSDIRPLQSFRPSTLRRSLTALRASAEP